MPSYATHPGKVTFADSDVPKKGTLFAVANVDGMLSLDDRITDKVVTCEVAPDGTLQGSGLKVPILSGLLWTLVFKPNDKAMGDKVLGTYNLNTSLVPLHTLVPTVVNSVTASVYADIQAAIALGATNDTATASFVNNGASSTTAALAAKYVGKNTVGHRLTDGPYLAAGDGVTSDHAALNSASAAAATSGLPVILSYTPNGYAFSAATNLVSGVTYILESGVVVKRVGTTNANFWNAAATTGVTIRGGTFDGNGLITGNLINPGIRTSVIDVAFTDSGQQQQSSYPIGAATTAVTSDVFVSRCRVLNLRNGIHIQGSASRWTVKECDITGYGSTGIAVDGDSTHSSTDIIIEGNRLHDHNATTLPVSNKAITGGNLATLTIPTQTYTVTNKALTSNVATLTVGAHNYIAGQWVRISGVLNGGVPDATFNGYYLITGVTGTTISYARTATDVTSVAAVGSTSIYTVGDTVYVDINDATYDGNHVLTGTTATTVSWAKTAANASTASAGYVAVGNRQPISIQGDTSEAAFHKRVIIRGNQIIGNYFNHQSTVLGGTADQISVHHTESFEVVHNICEGSGDVGITISLRAHDGLVANNKVRGAGNIGIAIGSATAVYIRDMTITDNNVTNCNRNGNSGWGGAGINIRTLTGGLVSANYCGDDQTTAVGTGAVTFTDSGDLVTTPAAHGLSVGQQVTFATIVTTTGISAGKFYYVLTTPSSTTLTLSATSGGSTLALTTDGTGTGLVVATPSQQYGISVGDTTGTSDQVHFGPNHGRGNVLGRRLTPAGNTNLTFTDIPSRATKPSDTASALSSTTLVNDPHLVLALEANATYEVTGVLSYSTNAIAGATPGFKFGWSALTGAAMFWSVDGSGSTATGSAGASSNSNRNTLTFGASATMGGHTGATGPRVVVNGLLTTSTTAGNLQLQAAQNTSDAVNATTLLTGSWLKATRVA